MPTFLFQRLYLLLVLLIGQCASLTAHAVGLVANGREALPLAGHLQILRDPDGRLQLQDILETETSGDNGSAFRKLRGDLSEGYTRDVIWLSFELSRGPEADPEWWLVATPTYVDDIRLYAPDGHGGFTERRGGDHVPLGERETAFRETIFRLHPSPASETYYIRLQNTGPKTLELRLALPETYAEQAVRQSLFLGLFFGMVLIAVLISALGALWLRQMFYVVATAYLLVYGALHFVLNGFDQFLIYPKHVAVSEQFVGMLICLATALYVFFFLSYLEPQRKFPRFAWELKVVAWLMLLGTVAAGLGFYRYFGSYVAMTHVVFLAVMLVATFAMFRTDPTRVTLYLLMFGPGSAAVLLLILRNVGLLPTNFFTAHLWEISVIFQIPFGDKATIAQWKRISSNYRHTAKPDCVLLISPDTAPDPRC